MTDLNIESHDQSKTKIIEKQNSSAVLRFENDKPRTIGVPESVSPKNAKETSHRVGELGSSEQLDQSVQGDSADSNFRLKQKNMAEQEAEGLQESQQRRTSKLSLKRSTFKVNEGLRPSAGAPNQQEVNPDNIVIEVKSEQSDRSAGQHPEY